MNPLNKDELERLPQEKLDELYEALSQLSRKTPKDWQPHPKQLAFHCSTKKGRIVLGGNRSGKTECGAVEAACHATGIYPSWYPKELRMNKVTKGRIVVSDFSKGFNESVKEKIDRWIPADLIKKVHIGHSRFIEKYELMNGSTFDICTHEQEDKVFEGWSGDWVWFDEPPPRSKFIPSLRGLIDRKGRYWMTMTPVSEAWIHDELVNSQDDDIFVQYVDMTDNPHISREEIDMFVRRLSPDEVEARLHGKFLHLSGVVYKNIEPTVHYRELKLTDKNSVFFKMPKLWYFVLDPHDRREHCGLWFFINPHNKKYIAYELHFKGTIKETCEFIRGFEKEHGIPTEGVIRIGDPNKMETPSAVSGYKLKNEFAKYGLYFKTNVDDDITRGHIAVREQFDWDKDRPLDLFNSPGLYFSENVKKCKEMFNKYSYLEWKGRTQDHKNLRETPQDRAKDFPDCVRYFIMSNPFYTVEKSSKPVQRVNPTSRTGYH